MIKKLIIDKLYVSTASKDGKPYFSKKTGEPFKKIDIYAKGLPDGAKSCGGFAFRDSVANGWKEGDEVVVELTPREYNGKTYWDFKPVSENVVMLLDLQARVEKLEGIVLLGKQNLMSAATQKGFKESAPKLYAKVDNGEPSEEELKSLFGGEI